MHGTGGDLVVGVWGGGNDRPTVVDWRAWRPPTQAEGLPAADRLTYGQIVPGDGAGASLTAERVSWTTMARWAE